MEPTTQEEMAVDIVARTVRDAFVAVADLYHLRLDPITAPLLAKEEGEIWDIQNRMFLLLRRIGDDDA